MKAWITAAFMVFVFTGQAQDNNEKRKEIIPDHVKLQFAGTIGMVSVGAGYEWAHHKLEGDLYYGYVPAWAGGVDIHAVTAKLTWLPVSTEYDNKIRVDWIKPGLLLNYAFGRRYHLFSRTKYSFVYYGFPTAAHIAVFIGGGVSKKKFGLYYEIGTTDRDLASYVTNTGAIPLTDIINIALGAKLRLY